MYVTVYLLFFAILLQILNCPFTFNIDIYLMKYNFREHKSTLWNKKVNPETVKVIVSVKPECIIGIFSSSEEHNISRNILF